MAENYLERVLSVLAAREFDFHRVRASSFPLVEVQNGRLVIVPDLLFSQVGKQPPPVLEFPAMNDSLHAILQHKGHDNIYILYDKMADSVLPNFCFKLRYFDDDDDDTEYDLSRLVQIQNNTKQYKVHPFVLDAIAMFAAQKQHPDHALKIYGTFLV